MAEQTGFSRVSRGLIVAGAFVVVVAGMKAASSIIVPFLLAAFIASICAPGLFWLHKKGVPKALAVGVIILLTIGVGVSLMAVVVPAVAGFVKAAPDYQAKLAAKMADVYTWMGARGIELPEQTLGQHVDPGMIVKLTSRTLTGLTSTLTNVFMILLTVVFILLEASEFPDKFRRMRGNSKDNTDYTAAVSDSISQYLAVKTGTSALTGVIAFVFLLILGVEYAVIWGLLAFLLNYVPNIGSILAAIPPVVMAMVQFGAGKALVVAIGYLAINTTIGNLLEPRLMGQRLGMSTLVVFLSLIFWGWVLGPVGMLLSVPLTMIIKIGLQNREDTRWVGILLSARAPGKGHAKPGD
jgi:predicted PurR-regulated permease PerM